MFFREKLSPNAKRPILQLVENIRTAKGPRQRLIVSLGSKMEIPKEDRSAAARLVLEQLQGQSNLFGLDPRLLSYADRIGFRRMANGHQFAPSLRRQPMIPPKFLWIRLIIAKTAWPAHCLWDMFFGGVFISDKF